MGNATVRWIGGKQFVGIDSTQHSVVLSTPDEGVGMKPSELLLVARWRLAPPWMWLKYWQKSVPA